MTHRGATDRAGRPAGCYQSSLVSPAGWDFPLRAAENADWAHVGGGCAADFGPRTARLAAVGRMKRPRPGLVPRQLYGAVTSQRRDRGDDQFPAISAAAVTNDRAVMA